MSRRLYTYLEFRPPWVPPVEGWYALASDIFVQTDGLLFALLGEENGLPQRALFPTRGLPKDVDPNVLQAYMDFGLDVVRASFLRYHELVQLQARYQEPILHAVDLMWAMPGSPVEGEWTTLGEGVALPGWLMRGEGRLRTSGDVALVRTRVGSIGPHFELSAILALLGVYEHAGLPTRMVYWFT